MSHMQGDDDEERLIEAMLRYVPEAQRAELRRELANTDGVVFFKEGPAELQTLWMQLADLRSRRVQEAIEAEERKRPRVDREPVLVALVSQVPDGLYAPVSRDTRAVIVRDPAAEPMDNILILEEDITPAVLVGAVRVLLGVRERDGTVPSDRKVLGAGGTWDMPLDEWYTPPQQARIRQWVNQLRTEARSRNVAGIGELQRTLILTPRLRDVAGSNPAAPT